MRDFRAPDQERPGLAQAGQPVIHVHTLETALGLMMRVSLFVSIYISTHTHSLARTLTHVYPSPYTYILTEYIQIPYHGMPTSRLPK